MNADKTTKSYLRWSAFIGGSLIFSFGRSSTEHLPLIQVYTPKRGRIHFIKTM
jgi:hypothetical protein